MRTLAAGIGMLMCFAVTATPPSRANQRPEPAALGGVCSMPGSARLRTTIYFGLMQRTGMVTETQWKWFLRNEVTPRFPEGLTVWEADGQWRKQNGRIARERSKVLLLVHEDTVAVRKSLADIVTSYKRSFQQESVLWESAPVCAAF